MAFAERNKHKITCINVSRHMQHYVVESNDSLLTRLPVPFRINCVLYKDYPKENLIPFIERFRKLPGANIQFRFDYTATPPANLYEPDKILHDLKEIAEYTGLDGCRTVSYTHLIFFSLIKLRTCFTPFAGRGSGRGFTSGVCSCLCR